MRLDTPLCETLRPDEKAAAAAGLVPLLPPSQPPLSPLNAGVDWARGSRLRGLTGGPGPDQVPHPTHIPPWAAVLCPTQASHPGTHSLPLGQLQKASPEGQMGQVLGAPLGVEARTAGGALQSQGSRLRATRVAALFLLRRVFPAPFTLSPWSLSALALPTLSSSCAPWSQTP